ncbi:MAG: hypothetical protein CL908_24815 [Deltaproteobacteria bacterium]|nr:hypothetical protein [Deltaproteobacteria bacterium]
MFVSPSALALHAGRTAACELAHRNRPRRRPMRITRGEYESPKVRRAQDVRRVAASDHGARTSNRCEVTRHTG